MKTFIYGVKQGFKNISSNKMFSLAAVGTIATCLFLMGIVYMILCNFHNMLHHAESSVGVTVFFDEGISSDDIEEIGNKIKNISSVEDIKFISAQEAWEKFRTEMYNSEDEITDTFGDDNPLENSASYEVYLEDVSEQENVSGRIREINGVRKVVGSSSVAKSLESFNVLFAYISVSIIILLFFISLFLISSAVASGIRVRRTEISIIKLIGATNTFVKLPFLVEGVVIGLVGAVIPLILLGTVYERIVKFVLGHFSVLTDWLVFVQSHEVFSILTPVLLILGTGIGFAGSAISVRKYINV